MYKLITAVLNIPIHTKVNSGLLRKNTRKKRAHSSRSCWNVNSMNYYLTAASTHLLSQTFINTETIDMRENFHVETDSGSSFAFIKNVFIAEPSSFNSQSHNSHLDSSWKKKVTIIIRILTIIWVACSIMGIIFQMTAPEVGEKWMFLFIAGAYFFSLSIHEKSSFGSLTWATLLCSSGGCWQLWHHQHLLYIWSIL